MTSARIRLYALRSLGYITAGLCFFSITYRDKSLFDQKFTGIDIENLNCVRREVVDNRTDEGIHIPNQTLYQQILGSTPEEWILQAPKIPQNVQLIVLSVIMNPAYEDRTAVRRSWGNKELPYFKNKTAAIIFLVGNNEEDLGCLLEESNAHNDLLIVKARDTYRGLVYKLLMAFRYLSKRYPEAHLVKVDRDMVLDIEQVIIQFQEINLPSFVAGKVKYHLHPIRDTSHVWHVPKSAYEDDIYPWFVQGKVYLLSSQALSSLLQTTSLFKIIELEDTFFTGILRHKAQVPLICLPYLIYFQMRSIRCSNYFHRRIIGLWIHKDDKVDEKYRELMDMKERTCEKNGSSRVNRSQ